MVRDISQVEFCNATIFECVSLVWWTMSVPTEFWVFNLFLKILLTCEGMCFFGVTFFMSILIDEIGIQGAGKILTSAKTRRIPSSGTNFCAQTNTKQDLPYR